MRAKNTLFLLFFSLFLVVPFAHAALDTNIVASYTFDNDSFNGSTYADSANNYDLTPAGVNTLSTGVINDSLLIDTKLDASAFSLGDHFSYCTWADTPSNLAYFWNFDNGGIDITKQSDSGLLYVYIQDDLGNNAQWDFDLNASLNNGGFYHLCVAFNGSNVDGGVKVYLNGTEYSTINYIDGNLDPSLLNNADTYGPLEFYKFSSGDRADETHFWANRTLTALEVEDLFNNESCGNQYPFTNGCVAEETPGESTDETSAAISSVLLYFAIFLFIAIFFGIFIVHFTAQAGSWARIIYFAIVVLIFIAMMLKVISLF